MQKLQFPPVVVQLLNSQWANQKRWCCVEDVFNTSPITHALGLPQGDPWSPLGLALVLLPVLNGQTWMGSSRCKTQPFAIIWLSITRCACRPAKTGTRGPFRNYFAVGAVRRCSRLHSFLRDNDRWLCFWFRDTLGWEQHWFSLTRWLFFWKSPKRF